MKIAVQLDDDRNINRINATSDYAAEKQSEVEGWMLVRSNVDFSISNKDIWTVRKSDNILVHISTGMTPDEEKTQADALLGKNVGTALAAAQGADKKADNAVAGLAQFGKLVAPLLATTQPTSNIDDGGTN